MEQIEWKRFPPEMFRCQPWCHVPDECWGNSAKCLYLRSPATATEKVADAVMLPASLLTLLWKFVTFRGGSK